MFVVGSDTTIDNLTETQILTHTAGEGDNLFGWYVRGEQLADIALKIDNVVVDLGLISTELGDQYKPLPARPLQAGEVVTLHVTKRAGDTENDDYRGVLYI